VGHIATAPLRELQALRLLCVVTPATGLILTVTTTELVASADD
jgi:hypothetical protein